MILENVYENKGYMAINFFKNESLIMELKEKYLKAIGVGKLKVFEGIYLIMCALLQIQQKCTR